MLLFVENSEIGTEEREELRIQVCKRLSESWKGYRVDLGFVLENIQDCPDSLRANLELADRLAPLMTTASQIAGNPRLIKRFLNTLAIRMSIAKAQHVAVDEAALAKTLLFERCASEEAYAELIAAINDGDEGKPSFLVDWEKQAQAGEKIEDLPSVWNTSFIMEWLALPPAFAEMDLRPVVYVSRDHMPIIASIDQFSSEASGVLAALLALETNASSLLADQLRSLSGRELSLITARLMVRARQEQEWGTPPVLWALLTVIDADLQQAPAFARFLESIPRVLLQPDIVPVFDGREWAATALEKWSQDDETPLPVRRAMSARARGTV